MTPPLRRRALLIGTESYQDDRFPSLPSCRADVWQLAQVLEHPSIGAFASVEVEVDLGAEDMGRSIARFLGSCEENHLALLYLTGHGVRMSQTTGEFFFVANDTDRQRIAQSAVGASYVNDELEACAAAHKVVILDCCQSGSFVHGWRTSDLPPAKSLSRTPVSSKGAYVIASSGADQASFAGQVGAAGPEPSLFTAQVVEALRTGRAGRDGSGQVRVGDLFEYVCERMRVLKRQIPEMSSLAVNDRIVLARCPQGPSPTLKPLAPRQPAAASHPMLAEAPAERPGWNRLLAYYRMCVQADKPEMPLMTVADRGTAYLCLTGAERLLSGDLDDDGATAITPEIQKFLDDADGTESELWAGYPAVVLTSARQGQASLSPRFAPLMIRRVEVVTDSGTIRLKPYGSVIPHPGLAHHLLGKEQADELSLTYVEGWQAGQHNVMADALGGLLRTEYELPCVQELRPGDLDSQIDLRSPGHGARNAAVLFRAAAGKDMSKRLLDDLAALETRLPQIEETALAALLPEDGVGPTSDSDADLLYVTPLPANAAQHAVMRSAMTRRLTVATGPPGTGKSQLVTNMIATAVANGQRVLIASTNNEAVDEVWRRCDDLVTDSLIRTGNREQKQKEAAALQRLSAITAPPGASATALADLALAARALDEVGAELGRVGAIERDLAEAGRGREAHAAALGQPVEKLAERLGTDQELRRWLRLAVRAGRARVFGSRRRTRLLRRLGLTEQPDGRTACAALAGFGRGELWWRELRGQATGVRGDPELSADLEWAEQQVRDGSKRLMELNVRSNAAAGRRPIRDLMLAGDQGAKDWFPLKAVLAHLRAWAVTSLSARRFPLHPALFDLVIIDEASQCAIPHVIPLLYRARRALIIGDVMQLPHIAALPADQEARIRRMVGLPAEWLEQHKLAYRRHSAFHAAEAAEGSSLLLDEHYRCHPDIARLSNQLFYGGALTILTDIRHRPALPGGAIRWSDVRGRASKSAVQESWLNQAEADRVVECVDYLLKHLPAGATIGAVTPFKAQMILLQRKLADRPVRIGTVHTFQGGECDAMVLSLVATEEMREGAINWVERQPNIWNVAITRARSLLIVVGDEALWGKRGGVAAGLLQAARGISGDGQPGPDELLLRLYQRVTGDTVSLDGIVRGHPVDVLVKRDEVTSAMLLDRGAPVERSPALHLEMMLRRRRLLDPAVRVPAWQLYG
ncbi:caspase family protein [Nonomuraea sp. K274]|uniref:Caspase family protein n=1 Tax=Nonomuraea cypriaca TaxID=1187855 RepID=A0A931F5S6_9ACTN|nr:AAA domain-containing protein [Nonomuraea cypriaca]MBF8192488.1 caspase family protein [Nonomuraea cypriaca]